MIVEVRLIKKNNVWGVTKFRNCFEYFCVELSRQGNLKTGLTVEDERELEEALSYPNGFLASSNTAFWSNYTIKVGDTPLFLNLDIPVDKLKYLVLKTQSTVATNIQNITSRTRAVLIDKESEAREVNRSNKQRREAIKEFDKLTIDEMRRCLRVMGRKSSDLSNELIESTLFDIVEEKPDEFMLKWVNNKNKEIEFLIDSAIDRNVLRKNKLTYYYGTDVIGTGKEEVVAYLQKAANLDVKKAIEAAVNAKVSLGD